MPSNLTGHVAHLALLFVFMTPAVQVQNATPSSTNTRPPAAAGPAGDAGAAANGPALTPPLRVGGPVKAPKAEFTPDPEYPDFARRVGYSGTVVLWLVVDTNGLPKDIKLERGLGLGLDKAAYEAVKKWRFKPATVSGQPVAVQINVEVNFRSDKFFTDLPLFPATQPKGKPPQFAGVDLAKYPLQLQISSASAVPAEHTYEIVANAAVDSTGRRQTLVISCRGSQRRCALLEPGYYAARWTTENKELEILGKENPIAEGWKKAEYSVKSQSPPAP